MPQILLKRFLLRHFSRLSDLEVRLPLHLALPNAVNSSITFIKRAKKQRFINYETIDETLVSNEILEYFTAKTKRKRGL